jgi:hypothetical protein
MVEDESSVSNNKQEENITNQTKEAKDTSPVQLMPNQATFVVPLL